MPYLETFASDPKHTALKWRRDLHSAGLGQLPAHHFEDIQGPATAGSVCVLHRGACRAAGPPGSDHLAVYGWPCQPFSRQRADRYKRPVATHPKEHVQQLVVNALLHHLPDTFVGENVLGFDDADHGEVDSPAQNFIQQMSERYFVLMFHLQLQVWVFAERPRLGSQL